jgi:hypothetical protein
MFGHILMNEQLALTSYASVSTMKHHVNTMHHCANVDQEVVLYS